MLKKFSFYLLILFTFLANVHFTYHHHVCNHSETEMLAQDDCCIAEIKEVEEVCNEDDSCCEVMSHQISFEADFWSGMSENYNVILGHLKHSGLLKKSISRSCTPKFQYLLTS